MAIIDWNTQDRINKLVEENEFLKGRVGTLEEEIARNRVGRPALSLSEEQQTILAEHIKAHGHDKLRQLARDLNVSTGKAKRLLLSAN